FKSKVLGTKIFWNTYEEGSNWEIEIYSKRAFLAYGLPILKYLDKYAVSSEPQVIEIIKQQIITPAIEKIFFEIDRNSTKNKSRCLNYKGWVHQLETISEEKEEEEEIEKKPKLFFLR